MITLKHRLRRNAFHTNEIRLDLNAADPDNLERLADQPENLCRNGLRSVARSMRTGRSR